MKERLTQEDSQKVKKEPPQVLVATAAADKKKM
jgi:hypothetical protein